MTKKIVIVTHDGSFHTDDVFACATLSLVFKDREVHLVRTRDEVVISRADIVVDVGGIYDPKIGRFDHHQPGGAGTRQNTIPYASFGLVWKEYGHMLAGSVAASEHIDEWLVQCIDGPDNAVGNDVSKNLFYTFSIGDVITAERPTWEESFSSDEGFMNAVRIAMHILSRAVVQTTSYLGAIEKLEEAYEAAANKKIVEIGKEYPGWYETMAKYPEPLYVVYEREDGKWSVKAVRKNPAEFPARKMFPETWAGLRDQALAAASGVPDAVFCHNGRFIAVARSKEGALALAKKASEA